MSSAIAPLTRVSDTPFVARVPGSKSFTNRALVIAAQRRGTTVLDNALDCDDTRRLAAALDAFGGIETTATGGGYVVRRDRAALAAPRQALDLGGAGTPARFLLSFAAAAEGATLITGNDRLCERPMDHLLEGLRAIGVRWECLAAPGRLPVRVFGSTVETDDWTIDGSVSSQFVSSLLIFAAQQPRERVTLRIAGHLVSRPYLDMTAQILERSGVRVARPDARTFVVTPTEPRAQRICIETDASGMSYFLAAAALTRSRVVVRGIGRGSAQGDLGFARILAAMGCRVAFNDDSVELEGAPLHGVAVDMETMPDTVLTLAVVASRAEGPTRIANIANLRVKECDRIHAAVSELRRLGCDAEAGADTIMIRPNGRLAPALVRTYDDHRVAMSFGLLRLLHDGVEIENPRCVGKSFPAFWDELARFRQHHQAGGIAS